MKKSLSLLIIVLVLSLMLSSCAAELPQVDPEGSYASEAASLPAAESGTSGEDTQEPDYKEDYFTKNGHSALLENTPVCNRFTQTEREYLYDCNLNLPNAEGYSVLCSGNNLILFYLSGDQPFCSMLSLETGEELLKTPSPQSCARGVLDNGGFWTFDLNDYKLVMYDCDGKELPQKAVLEFYTAVYPNDVYVTPDASRLLIASGSAPLEIFDLNTGERVVAELNSEVYIYDVSETETDFILKDTNMGIYTLNKETYRITALDNNENIYGIYGGLYQFASDDSLELGSVYSPERVYMPIDPYESITDIDCGVAVTSMMNEYQELHFYDLRNKKTVVPLTFDETCLGVYCEILPSGNALIMEIGAEGNNIYIYDLVTALCESDRDINALLLCTEKELLQSVDEIAEEIYAEMGVELVYGTHGNDYDIYGYVGVAELNAYKIYRSVNEINEILLKYPSGMLRESYEFAYKGIKIYLCGTIYGTDESALSQAGGFVSDYNSYIVLVLDINDTLGYNLPHELSHVFDKRIGYLNDSANGADWFALWESATPVENAYINSYNDYYDYYEYTYASEDIEDVWFVDSYSRTFPTEDRARIMEHLFNPDPDGTLNYVFDSPNLVYKAKVYNYILRQCFDSCNTEAENYWEKGIGAIDVSLLPK